eukprot:snap_masked-scaffold_9-processed-gene-2.61-mRNA-1 protein AED:1.00 eAED:1.00 QI:0/-1/0/0/-1/1/1/0/489
MSKKEFKIQLHIGGKTIVPNGEIASSLSNITKNYEISEFFKTLEAAYGIKIKSLNIKRRKFKLENINNQKATLGKNFNSLFNARLEVELEGGSPNPTYKDLNAGEHKGPTMSMTKSVNVAKLVEDQEKQKFYLKGDKPEYCEKASLDPISCQGFISGLVSDKYQKWRCGLLLGKIVDSTVALKLKKEEEELAEHRKINQGRYGSTQGYMNLSDLGGKLEEEKKAKEAVIVDFIFEPMQKSTKDTFIIGANEVQEENLDKILEVLGLEVVGMVVFHPRTDDFVLSGHEVITAALYSADSSKKKYSEPKKESPFALVKTVVDENNNISFEPYTLTASIVDMVIEDAIEQAPETPSHVAMKSPFKAVVEMKETYSVDTDFFIKAVPVFNLQSDLTRGEDNGNMYPRMNRAGIASQTKFKNFVRGVIRGKQIPQVTEDELKKIFLNFHALFDLLMSKNISDDELKEIKSFRAGKNAKPNELRSILAALSMQSI